MPITKASGNSVTAAAKGDLVVGNATNDSGVLSVGANNTVLTADSSTATGVKWAAVSAFEPFLTQETSTEFIRTSHILGGGISSLLGTQNTTYYCPIFIPTCSVDRISFRTSGGSTTGNYRMGLYNVSSTTGKPSTVVFDAGTVSANAQNTVFSITISQNIAAGWYYLAINRQSGGYEFTTGTATVINYSFASTQFNLSGNSYSMFAQASVTGAFATAGAVDGDTNNTPILIGLRVA